MIDISIYKKMLDEQIWAAFNEAEKLDILLNMDEANACIPLETLVMVSSEVTRFKNKFRILKKELGDTIDIVKMAKNRIIK